MGHITFLRHQAAALVAQEVWAAQVQVVRAVEVETEELVAQEAH
jgi:hypothetical protein